MYQAFFQSSEMTFLVGPECLPGPAVLSCAWGSWMVNSSNQMIRVPMQALPKGPSNCLVTSLSSVLALKLPVGGRLEGGSIPGESVGHAAQRPASSQSSQGPGEAAGSPGPLHVGVRRGDKSGGFGVGGRRLSGGLRAGGVSPGGWHHPLQKGTWALGALGNPAPGMGTASLLMSQEGQSPVPERLGRTLSSLAGPWAGKTGSVGVGRRSAWGACCHCPSVHCEGPEPPDTGAVSSPQPSPSPQRTQTLEKGRESASSRLMRVKNGTEEGKSHAI